MPEHFNKLTPGEAERLAILAEEAGEVVQIIGKILRHGYESYNPFDPNKISNRELLQKEIADLICSVKMLSDTGDISESTMEKLLDLRLHSKKKYTHHQDQWRATWVNKSE